MTPEEAEAQPDGDAPPSRVSTRAIMALVALVAVALGAWRWGEARRSEFRALAHRHHGQYWHYAYRATGLHDEAEPRDYMRSAYHRAMMEKYRCAAEWPWLPVPPDWPEPGDVARMPAPW